MTKRFLLKKLSRYNIGTFADIILRNAILYPESEAFIYNKERISNSQYNSRVNKIIRALQKMGVSKGDVLGILSWNCLQFAEFYGVTLKGGYIASPFNPGLKADELDYIINYSEANSIFVGPELVNIVNTLRPRLLKVKNYISLEGSAPDMISYQDLLDSYSDAEPNIKVTEDDPVCIIYTSGTTGIPRGALYNHRCFIDDARTFALNVNAQRGDKYLQIKPLFHIAGNTWLRTFMYIGGCTIIHKSFNALATLNTIQDERVTHVNIVPTQLIALLDVPNLNTYDMRSIKYIWYGGSPMPLEVLKRGLEAFGNIFGQGYGQSESGPGITSMLKEDHDVLNKPEREQRHLLSVGKPDIGVQVRIVDDNNIDCEPNINGEIIVKSKHIMTGYWKKPEDTKNTIVDGWLHTGDIGYYDDKGYIYITDRKKDMIITGGENVFSREVEEVLYKHPAVLEAAVIGIPDNYWVEKVHAVIVVRKGEATTSKEIIAFCKKHLAGYKAPKSVEFVDTLPKNAAGKILKKDLREKYWQEHVRKI